MKRYFLLICIMVLPSLLWGQIEYKEEKTKVNSIKKNSGYVYGEGIAESEMQALEIAEQSLRSAVMGVISEKESLQDAETILVNAIKRNSSQIKLKRGTMDRVFLYVSKDNIFPSGDVMAIHRGEEITFPEEEDADFIEESEEEIDIDSDISDFNEELLAESGETDIEKPVEKEPNAQSDSPIVTQLIRLSDMTSLQSFLKAKKEEHKVMWGNVASDINPSWYIIAYSGNEVKAVFDKGLNTRLNYLSGERESLSNYSQYKKIWFMTYE